MTKRGLERVLLGSRMGDRISGIRKMINDVMSESVGQLRLTETSSRGTCDDRISSFDQFIEL